MSKSDQLRLLTMQELFGLYCRAPSDMVIREMERRMKHMDKIKREIIHPMPTSIN